MTKKFLALGCLVLLASALTAIEADAGWKNRGWYVKKPGANCVMRKVVITGYSGKATVKRVRVCG